METNYDVDYFIRKFRKIPSKNWLVGGYSNSDGKRCASGHCMGKDNEFQSLYNLMNTHLKTAACTINDGGDERYKQPTPKLRILAALYDIKKMQHPPQPVYADIKIEPTFDPILDRPFPADQYADITKSLAVLPVDKIETDVFLKNVKIN